MMQKYIIPFILMILLHGCAEPPTEKKEISFPVKLGKAVKKSVPIYLEYIGNVFPITIVNITPQAGGILLESHVKEGDMVVKDQLLYTIDPRPYEADLNRAMGALARDQAQLAIAENKVERYSKLLPGDFVSQLDFDQLVSNVDAAKGQVKFDEADIWTAQINLGYTQVRAPMDGMISVFKIYPGNVVVANDPNAITVLLQMKPIDIQFSVPQNDFITIQDRLNKDPSPLKAKVLLTTEETREGTIAFIDNTLNLNTGTILIKARVPNEDYRLWPGEFVRTQIILRIDDNAILIPAQAVEIGQQGRFVFVYKSDHTVELRPIKVGRIYGNEILVESGLSEGETVVTDGQINLKTGSKVYETTKSLDENKVSL